MRGTKIMVALAALGLVAGCAAGHSTANRTVARPSATVKVAAKTAATKTGAPSPSTAPRTKAADLRRGADALFCSLFRAMVKPNLYDPWKIKPSDLATLNELTVPHGSSPGVGPTLAAAMHTWEQKVGSMDSAYANTGVDPFGTLLNYTSALNTVLGDCIVAAG